MPMGFRVNGRRMGHPPEDVVVGKDRGGRFLFDTKEDAILGALPRDVSEQHSNPPRAEMSDAVAETLFMPCAGGIKAAARQWTTTDLELSLKDVELRAVMLVREAVERMK